MKLLKLRNSKNIKKGFTLIELLVVISIIAILSTVVLGALNDSRAKARDRKLILSVLELQKAVEVFKTQNGYYPGEDLGTDTFYWQIGKDSNGNIINDNGGGITQSAFTTYLASFLSEAPIPTSNNTYIGYGHIPDYNCGNQNLGTDVPYLIWLQPETYTDSIPSYSTFLGLPPLVYVGGSTVYYPDFRCISIQ